MLAGFLAPSGRRNGRLREEAGMVVDGINKKCRRKVLPIRHLRRSIVFVHFRHRFCDSMH